MVFGLSINMFVNLLLGDNNKSDGFLAAVFKSEKCNSPIYMPQSVMFCGEHSAVNSNGCKKAIHKKINSGRKALIQ